MKAKTYAVIAASMVCCLLTGCGKTEINANEYCQTDLTGYNGTGNVSMMMNFASLVANNYEAFGLTKDDTTVSVNAVAKKLENTLVGSFDKQTELSNGDTVKFTWNSDGIKNIEKEYNIKLNLDTVEVNVSDLQEIIDFNPFDHIKLQYSGIAPNANVMIDNSELADMDIPKNVSFIDFEVTPNSGLSIGDTIKVTIDEERYNTCLYEGYRLTETEKEYTVEALDGYLIDLDQLPADAKEKMEKNGQDVLQAEIASYWDTPSDLESISLLGNYLLTPKEIVNGNILVFVYEIKTKDFSYYSYVKYRDVMLLADGTCSFNLTATEKPNGSVGFGTWGTVFEHNNLYYIGYADLDSLFNEAVTQMIDVYKYQSTVP